MNPPNSFYPHQPLPGQQQQGFPSFDHILPPNHQQLTHQEDEFVSLEMDDDITLSPIHVTPQSPIPEQFPQQIPTTTTHFAPPQLPPQPPKLERRDSWGSESSSDAEDVTELTNNAMIMPTKTSKRSTVRHHHQQDREPRSGGGWFHRQLSDTVKKMQQITANNRKALHTRAQRVIPTTTKHKFELEIEGVVGSWHRRLNYPPLTITLRQTGGTPLPTSVSIRFGLRRASGVNLTPDETCRLLVQPLFVSLSPQIHPDYGEVLEGKVAKLKFLQATRSFGGHVLLFAVPMDLQLATITSSKNYPIRVAAHKPKKTATNQAMSPQESEVQSVDWYAWSPNQS